MDSISQVLTSLEVAELMGRPHKKVLETIRLYISQMEEVGKKNGTSPEEGRLRYFIDSAYIAGNGQEQPCYNVTKIGCEFLAHKMKGIKGTEFTMRYIDRFHKMEEAIRTPKTLQQQIQTIAQGTAELYERLEKVDNKVEGIKKDLEKFKADVPAFNMDTKDIQDALRKKAIEVLGGKDSNAYHDNSVRGYAFADIQIEVRRQFDVKRYDQIKHKDVPVALKVIEEYKPPIHIRNKISMANSQINLDFGMGGAVQ